MVEARVGRGRGQTSEPELRRRAIARALANGGAETVERVRYGHYVVASASRPGTTHTVRVVGATWHCTCEAALAGRACWHRAAVLIAKVEHGGGRVTGPAAPRPATLAPAAAGVIPLPQRHLGEAA
jgi:hypothetical protein